MKNYPRTLIVVAVLVAMSAIAIPRPALPLALAQGGDEELWRLYNDPEQFECLSTSAQTLLENKFGRQTSSGISSYAVTPGDLGPSDDGSATIIGPADQDPSLGTIQPLNALPTPPVNNPAADLGAQDTQSETSIVLGSGSNVIVGFNDSGSFIGGAQKFTGFGRSTDMGATWTDGGTLPTNPNGDAGDPVLARDNSLGRTYFSTLEFTGTGLRIFRSDDDGATWMAPTQGAPGFPSGFQDKEWLAVDNFAGPGQGNVYLAWRSFSSGFTGIRFTRSTDNGATFGPATGLLIKAASPANVQGAWVTVGADHAVYVFWYDQNFTPRQIRMRKSTDFGLTFGPETSVTTLTSLLTNGGLGLNGGFRSNSFPQVAVNPTDANKLYIVYNDPALPTGGDRGNIFFRQSTDGGSTWGAAVQLNTDATTNDQFFPTIAVKPDGSGLAASWYDRRRDPANNLIERWGVIGTISGATVTFGANFRIGGQFPVVIGQDPVINTVYMGDYDQMAADNSFFYGSWSDNSLPNPNFPAHQRQPDVRFAKIPMAGPGPILDATSFAISGGDGDGVVEANECNELTVQVANNGSATATGVVGVLTTSTPGVTVTQPISDYPDLAPGATGTNITPFKISTSPGFVCGTPISLTLALTYAQGTDSNLITVPTCLCAPATVTGSIGAGDPTSTGRPFRADPPSTCAAPQTCAVFNPAGLYRYDTHTFTNGGAPACVTVTVTTPCTGANFIQAAAYLGSFNPANVCQNFLADIGASPGANVPKSFSFVVPAYATIVLVIHESFVAGGCSSYSATVSGLICGSTGPGECPPGCVRTQGYWKTHPEAWPVTSLTLGTVTYSQAELLSILSQSTTGNGLVSLAKQLIAARLNLANGAAVTPATLNAIVAANSLIDGLVIPPVGTGSLAPSLTSGLTTTLNTYNNGLASGGPPHCP